MTMDIDILNLLIILVTILNIAPSNALWNPPRQGSWGAFGVDAFNVALTSSIHAQPSHATCGHPQAWSAHYVNATSGLNGTCVYDCGHSRRYPDRLHDVIEKYSSDSLRDFQGRSFWASGCDPYNDGSMQEGPSLGDPCFSNKTRYNETEGGATHTVRIKPEANLNEG